MNNHALVMKNSSSATDIVKKRGSTEKDEVNSTDNKEGCSVNTYEKLFYVTGFISPVQATDLFIFILSFVKFC